MTFFLKALGLADSVPGFPFTPVADEPGRTVYTSPQMCWSVRPGTQKDDAQARVSIFTCSVATAATSGGSSGHRELIRQLAQNTIRRAKSLMIPGFLKCYGAVEHSDTVYIATEPCVSLRDVLESAEWRKHFYGHTSEEYTAAVAYGLDTVSGALAALQSNRLVHGNVHCGSIFVSAESGFWRLFGLEFISAIDDVASGNPGCLFESARRAGMITGYRCPPELGSSSCSDISTGDSVVAVDAWGIACLLYETMGVTAEEAAKGKLNSLAHSLSAAELRNACRQSLPKSLHQGCSNLTAPNPRMRKSIAVFAESCEFVKHSTFVYYMKSLSELLLMDVSQQVRLVESLTGPVEKFPLRACLCFVLPRLGELVRTAAKAGSGGPGGTGVSMGPVVEPVLRIAQRTAAGEDFDKYVTPVLVQLYQSTDVLLRYKLLVGAEAYGAKVSPTALNNAIWPLYVKGFAYSAPSVREYSARALVHLAPHMSESILGDQVPRALGQLQRDVDGALRANATIALNLISEHITPPPQRAMVMLMYCRPMLRDVFAPSRVAALRSLHGALECLSPKQLAESMLPAISALTVDPTSVESRTAALSLLKASLSRLEAHHEQLSAQQVVTAAGVPAAANGSADASLTSLPVPATAPAETPSKKRTLLGGITASSAPSAAGTAPHHVDAVTTPLMSGAASPLRSTPGVAVTSLAGSGGSGWSDDDEEGEAGEHDGERKANTLSGSFLFSKAASPPPPTRTPMAPFLAGAKPISPAASSVASSSASPLSATGGAHGPTPSFQGPASSPVSQPLSTISNVSGVSSRTGINSRLTGGISGAAHLGLNSGTNGASVSLSSGPMKLRKKGGLGAARLD
ncbi:hypothetical protein LSCM1_04683 [Leishmania martiniquensis]|uniref:Protein kinase domain-containing protein n=1 Tax=Leishmania martiniquensis TaxID=1580590 RepID=A0A836KNB6_9TRYP|nr:hypothetical protein LSCM1_04683 [Leishmania martiniquensis]